MLERRPSLFLLASTTGVLIAVLYLHFQTYYSSLRHWRDDLEQTPITPAWWADAALQLTSFGLQALAVGYAWLPAGYALDMRKTLLVEAVALPWQLHWIAISAADALHAVRGPAARPVALALASLAGAVLGFGALYGMGLRRLHPLLTRMHAAERSSGGGGGASSLMRRGTGWAPAYALFRLPTALAAALCAARAAVDGVAAALALGLGSSRAWLNPALGLLLCVMVLGIVVLNQLDDPAFAAAVGFWLAGLIAASHTQLMVKGFCIALVVALAMRCAVKYVPEEDGVGAGAGAKVE